MTLDQLHDLAERLPDGASLTPPKAALLEALASVALGPAAPPIADPSLRPLVTATEGLTGEAYTTAFKAELAKLREEAVTVGSELNTLITKQR